MPVGPPHLRAGDSSQEGGPGERNIPADSRGETAIEPPVGDGNLTNRERVPEQAPAQSGRLRDGCRSARMVVASDRANLLGPWWRRALHGGLAAMFVSLGVAGAVLPGLPATPFLLLASFFLSRSSPRLNERLHRCLFIGQLLQDWEQQRGVRPSTKIQAVGMIVLCVGATVAFSSLPGTLLGLIAVAAGVGILVVLRLPSAKG